MSRQNFKPAVKVAAWNRCKGLCEKCGTVLRPGKFAYDHIIADGLGGEPTLANCEVLCDPCHDEKTASHDVPRIAKSKRIEAKHLGAKAPPRRSIPQPPKPEKPPSGKLPVPPPQPLFRTIAR